MEEELLPARSDSRRPGAVAAVALAALALAGAGCGREESSTAPREAAAVPAADEEAVLTPDAVDPDAVRAARRAQNRAGGRIVDLRGAGEPKTYSRGDYVSPGAPTDSEVRTELRDARAELSKFTRFLGSTAYLQTGPRARVLPDGTAVAPAGAPEPIKRVIQAGNAIAKFPYKWGGGHGAWRDDGYDCSGSVSFALAAAGLVESPLTSGGFMTWGTEGVGDWITVYSNPGHMYMVVAGLRFDTSGRGRAGTRWQEAPRETAGYAVRHQPGY